MVKFCPSKPEVDLYMLQIFFNINQLPKGGGGRGTGVYSQNGLDSIQGILSVICKQNQVINFLLFIKIMRLVLYADDVKQHKICYKIIKKLFFFVVGVISRKIEKGLAS